ncbi:MAG: hypothetical protein AVDCRST_MAG86-925 [uncultured Truepera sp.]|uniref:Uncharacterized protein n=1 Tax=uncultured Truepera sp. TaxID=543023 RepID=A0A6J4V209_9DEIN|nr:MAG: hypothetical protein AVDCRST_MAG86-925 [uncultured Truepera sp.]
MRVTYKDGAQVLKIWRSITKRHAFLKAREHYRNVARADFADGEP